MTARVWCHEPITALPSSQEEALDLATMLQSTFERRGELVLPTAQRYKAKGE
jgi:hypothetical protein